MDGNFLIGIAIGVAAAILGMSLGMWIIGRNRERDMREKIRQIQRSAKR